jgi:RNA polymerase sigma-70 factor (ECF subfamily)
METPDEFREMYTRHYDAVLRYAWRRVGADAAPDVAAEVFTTAWRRMADVPRQPLPWLYGVARNVVANHARGRQRADRLLARVPRTTELRDIGDQVTSGSVIRQAWQSLGPGDRELLALIGWEGLTVGEAARALGCTAAACSVRLYRARRRLRGALEELGHHGNVSRREAGEMEAAACV